METQLFPRVSNIIKKRIPILAKDLHNQSVIYKRMESKMKQKNILKQCT